ncbi:hypothetical protein ACGIF2_07355 [Cellulomonas sp. P22]|uniref:hypothetical protein n=1 Tax=Cellulomonas sp. P22 TaxID=3373189 RepID=UPI00378E725A
MSDLTPLPAAMDVRDVLAGLIGRDVQVVTGGSMVDPAAEFGALVGAYVDRHQTLGALILMDLELASRAGAAIALLPTPTAERAIGAGLMPDNLLENASEILNVLASLFNAEDAPHLKLGAVYAPGDPVPNDVAQWIGAFVRRIDLDVDVKGYGSGRFSLLVV